jgi:arsenate reductase
MKHIYYLSTCNTCKKIIDSFGPLPDITLQDLKVSHISESELEDLAQLSGSYESLFNKRSRLYTSEGLSQKTLGESDYKSIILSHYTFLKRPVIKVDHALFVGYKKDTIAAAFKALKS